MPASAEDYKKIVDSVAAKTMEASDYGSAALTLRDEVMNAVVSDRQGRGVSKLASDVGATMGQMSTDPAGIRSRTSGMVNPIQEDMLTANQRGQNLNTLGTISTQMTQNTRSLDDIINAGANQLNAKANVLQGEASVGQYKANAMMDEMKLAEEIRQFNEQLALEKAKMSGSGSGDNWFNELLTSMFLQAPGGQSDDGFIEDTPEEKFGTLEAVRELTPDWMENPTKFMSDKVQETMQPQNILPLALQVWSNYNKYKDKAKNFLGIKENK